MSYLIYVLISSIICAILSYKLTSGLTYKVTMILVSSFPFLGVFLLSKFYYLIDGSTKGGAPMYETLYYTVSAPFTLSYIVFSVTIFMFYRAKTIS